MPIDIVSFDLDGTLVDTAAQIADAANRALRAQGLAPRDAADIAALIGHGGRQLMIELLARAFSERSSLADTIRIDAVFERFERELAQTTVPAVPYDGAADALARLGAAGVKLACTTNKETRAARRILDAARLLPSFDLVIGGDSLPHRKPHASVLRHVVATLDGETGRAAHVGDSAIDVEAARNAGVAAWAVPYGYNSGRPVAEAGPERVFATLAEVADLVLAGRAATAAAGSPAIFPGFRT